MQEATATAAAAGGKIPPHLATENYIPAVLSASSIAITDGSIDPDNVEIAVLTSHQPLASQGAHHHHRASDVSLAPEITEDLAPPSTSHSSHSLSGFPTDKRRLSFISFSDIVQAETADLLDSTILSPQAVNGGGFQAVNVMDQVGISSIQETLVRRSPSPMGRGASPHRGLRDRGERDGVLVETMGQALRKTGSGDLGRGEGWRLQ